MVNTRQWGRHPTPAGFLLMARPNRTYLFKDVLLEREEKPDATVPKHVKLVVAGLTRGGTQYTAWVLRKLGVVAGHEAVFGGSGPRATVMEWKQRPITVEVSGLAAPWVDNIVRDGVPVVHLIRHPVKCVNSNLNFFSHGLGHGLSWDVVCKTYLDWHQAIEKVAQFTIHLERFAESIRALLGLARPNPYPSQSAIDEALKFADRGAKCWQTNHGGWQQLPKELQEYAASHGYSKDC